MILHSNGNNLAKPHPHNPVKNLIDLIWYVCKNENLGKFDTLHNNACTNMEKLYLSLESSLVPTLMNLSNNHSLPEF